ncbi:MAG: hypothetical protein WCH43_14290, partial [Verrucomicrobiota bacterium]
TQDIVPIYWGPDPLHVNPDDRHRFQSTYDDIQQRFGIELGLELEKLPSPSNRPAADYPPCE